MVNPSFKQFTERNNYEVDRNVAYGEKNGYLVTFCQLSYHKMFLLPLPGITNAEKQKIFQFLTPFKKEYSIKSLHFDNTVFIIKLRESIRFIPVEILEKVIDEVTKFLKDNEICLGEHCIICGKEDSDQKVRITGIEYYVHQNCYDRLTKEIETEFKDRNESTSKKTKYGFIGSIIGAFMVGFAWYFISEFGWISALVMLLCAHFSLKGYRFINLRLDKNAYIWSIVSVLFSYLISSYLIIISNKPQLIDVFNNTNVLINLGVGLATSLAGFVISWFINKRIERRD